MPYTAGQILEEEIFTNFQKTHHIPDTSKRGKPNPIQNDNFVKEILIFFQKTHKHQRKFLTKPSLLWFYITRNQKNL